MNKFSPNTKKIQIKRFKKNKKLFMNMRLMSRI